MGRGKQAGSEGLDTGTYKDLLVPAGALASSVAGAGRGVLSQSLGLPGDLEGLGREGLNWLGKNYSDEFTPYGELPPSKKTNILSDDTFLPKTEEYRDKILPQIGEDTYAKLGSYSPVAPGVYLNAIKQSAKGVKAANKGVKALKIKSESFDKTKTPSDTVDESRRKFIKNTGILAASAALPAAVKGLHGLEEARGIKALEEVAPVARNAAHLRNLALLRSAREAWKAKIAKIADDFHNSEEGMTGHGMYDDESALGVRLNAMARKQNLIPDAQKQLLENGYENPIQTIYNKHKDALDALESQGEKELRIKQKELEKLGKNSRYIYGISPEINEKKYKIFYEELKSMFGDDIPKEYMRDVDRYIDLTGELEWFNIPNNGFGMHESMRPRHPDYMHESMHPRHPDYNKNSITAILINDQDHINYGYENKYQSGGIVNDPMNPMGQMQTTSPMNPMGLGETKQQAYGLASLGRNDDSMLVHMTPKEVASLQNMAMANGGSLTTNPNTGLPEAGFLDSILPAIVGIAAAPFTAGTSLAFLGNPLIAGGLAGLGAMIANGGDLREGLKWGLGVGAGTGLANGIQSMVTPVAKVGQAGAASSGAVTSSVPAATAPLNGGLTTTAGAGTSAGVPTVPIVNGAVPAAGVFNPVSPSAATAFGGQTASKLLGTGLPAAAKLGAAGIGSMAMQRPEPLKVKESEDDKDFGPGGKYEYKGPYTYPEPTVTYATPEEIQKGVEHNYFGENYNRPPQYIPARKEGGPVGMAKGGSTGEQMYFPQSHFNAGTTTGVSNTPANLQAAGDALRGFFGQQAYNMKSPPQMPPWQQINASGQVQNTRAPTQEEMNFADSARTPYYGMGMGNRGNYADNWLRANQLATQNQPKTQAVSPNAPMTTNQGGYSNLGEQMFFTPSYFSAGMSPGYAAGGIASLPGMATAGGMTEGLLNGPGDGMSDSIPATIDGKQEARLATGEFVIPADVVSHLGNGATEPGAKVLYAMMDRVRQARTGNPKQGKEIEPEKFLPA